MQKRVDICVNDDWFRECGPLEERLRGIEPDPEALQGAVKRYRNVLKEELRHDDRAQHLTLIPARQPLTNCAEGGGAQFAFMVGGVATSEHLTDSEKAAIREANECATEEAIVTYDLLSDDEIDGEDR